MVIPYSAVRSKTVFFRQKIFICYNTVGFRICIFLVKIGIPHSTTTFCSIQDVILVDKIQLVESMVLLQEKVKNHAKNHVTKNM